MKKNVKGITLVSMVITIIVMLILAGVSISMVVGDNGVLTRASEGSVKTNLSSVESDIGLSITSNQTEYFARFSESAAMAGNKQTYLTVENLNEFCSGVKLLGNVSGAKDVKSHKFLLDGVESGITISVSKSFVPTGALSRATGIYFTDPKENYDLKLGKEATSQKDTASASGYKTTILYFSDGADSLNIGTNLYAVAVHFEKGFFKIDDVGIIKTKGSKTLTQGALYSAEKSNLTALNVQWLKEVAK